MNKKYNYVLALIGLVIVVGVIYIYAQQEKPVAKNINVPTDNVTCKALGGRWGSIGLLPKEVCNLPTTDAGKICSDSEQCQGACIAELSNVDEQRAARGIVYTNGRCSSGRINVGCMAFVENGKVQGILCVD